MDIVTRKSGFHIAEMDLPDPRPLLLRRLACAHVVGLVVTAIVISANHGYGLRLYDVAMLMWLGGLFSFPWVCAIAALVWFYEELFENPKGLVLFGPLVVCGTYGIFMGTAFLKEVAFSSVTSSACYLFLALSQRNLDAVSENKSEK